MNGSLATKCGVGLGAVALVAVWFAGCQSQSSNAVTSRPSRLVVWGDPQGLESRGTAVRDWNNSDADYVVIGTNGQVQFADGSVCDSCETDIDNARITLGSGDLIDIRFGVHPEGDDTRRPYLVDVAAGTFVDLGGGGDEAVTFTPTTEPFGDPEDETDDRAVVVDEQANPVGESQNQQTSLCGALGGSAAGTLLLVLMATGPLALRRHL